jgi:hypothetical protein
VSSVTESEYDNFWRIDDSVFVNTFGVGTNGMVVYKDATTGNISIRAAFNISGRKADTAIDGITYRALFLQGIEDGWSGVFEDYAVSAYARENTKGIKVNIKAGDGVSSVSRIFGWSKKNLGSAKIDILDRGGSGNLKTADDFKWSVMHELGHLLGVDDAYNTKTGLPTQGVTSVMNACGTGVQAVDIAKVLNAWKTKKWQKW